MKGPRYKRLTPEQLGSLPPLNELKLENKILRAPPSSPIQKELKQQLEEMREARRQKESEAMKKSNDAYQPVNNRTLADINRANTRANDSTVPEQSMMDAETEMNQAEGKNRHGQTKAEVEAELKKFRAMPSTRERRHRIEYLEKMLTSEYTSDAPAKDGGPGSGPQEGSGGQSGKNQVRRQKAKSDLEAKGYKNVGLNKSTGSMIYKHPKEKGSVLLTPEGEVLANE